MKYEYTHLIPQNSAPPEAKKIGVYNAAGKRTMGFPVGRMTPPEGTKLYSFGLISDTHIQPDSTDGEIYSARLETALAWFKEQGVAFVAHCGDITNVGLYMGEGSSPGYYPDQFAEFKRICDLYPDLPVYSICGNHDSYYSEGPIESYKTELRSYTGHGLYYYAYQGNDLLIFISQPSGTSPLNEAELNWLEVMMVSYPHKRCFVFMHPYISGDSGNTLDAYGNALLPASSTVTTRVKKALAGHGNVVLFHGHTHFMPSMQELDELTNYTNKNGFHSVHVPSLSAPAFVNEAGERQITNEESYGYLVDVYDDCILLRGRDFVKNQWIPIGTFKINCRQ